MCVGSQIVTGPQDVPQVIPVIQHDNEQSWLGGDPDLRGVVFYLGKINGERVPQALPGQRSPGGYQAFLRV